MTIGYSLTEGVAHIVLNRPERRNALDLASRIELADRMEEAAGDSNVRAVLISSVGDHFCAGADVGQFGDESIPASRQRMRRGGARLIRTMSEMDKPVIAAVRGAAIAFGWGLALACDQVIAGTSAKFAFTYANIGLVPDAGSGYLLVRQLGLLRAKALLLSGRFVPAEEAFALGLVSEVVDDADLEACAMREAKRLAAGPTFAFGMMKRILHAAAAPSVADFLEFETLIAPQLRFTEDFKEGTSAFREKRAPHFKGR